MDFFFLTGIVKEADRGEREFRAFNNIIFFILFMGKDSNLTILFNLSFRIF